MELELLKQLYRIYSPSRGEKKMRKFIKDWIRKNVPYATNEVDNLGNLYVRRGESETYPTIVAHMDQVQKTHSRDFQVVETNEILFGFSLCNVEMQGLGADDKNGIWIALKCLQKYPVMKCAFFVGEEIGCVGSEGCDMSFFDDSRYVLQCDRRGGHDLIWNIGGWTQLCSPEFLDAIGYQDFGYKKELGMMTDVEALKNRGLKVSVCNLSCGYGKPHSDEEFTKKSELLNCLAFVEHIVETCLEIYPHEDTDLGYYGGYGKGYYGTDYDTDYDELSEFIIDFLYQYPDATLEDVQYEFGGRGGYDSDLIQMTYEDVKSLYF